MTFPRLFEELADVLETKFYWRKPDIEHTIVQLRAFANHVTPSESLKVVRRHADDDTILKCAASARSDYVVTGDKGNAGRWRFQRRRKVTFSEDRLR